MTKLYRFDELSESARIFAIYDEIKSMIEMGDDQTEDDKKFAEKVCQHNDFLQLLIYIKYLEKNKSRFKNSRFKKNGTFVLS